MKKFKTENIITKDGIEYYPFITTRLEKRNDKLVLVLGMPTNAQAYKDIVIDHYKKLLNNQKIEVEVEVKD